MAAALAGCQYYPQHPNTRWNRVQPGSRMGQGIALGLIAPSARWSAHDLPEPGPHGPCHSPVTVVDWAPPESLLRYRTDAQPGGRRLARDPVALLRRGAGRRGLQHVSLGVTAG